MELMGSVLLLCVGFVMLIKGSDFFVEGASRIAEKFGIPQLVIGLTIVAMGTSAPEAAVSITAALRGNADITVGNVVGSNILNILVILGLSAVVAPLAVTKSTVLCEMPFMIGITLLLLLFSAGGNIGLLDGILLMLLFLVYLAYLFRMAKKGEASAPALERKSRLWKSLIGTAAGLALIVAGSYIAVDAASAVARLFGMTERFIGLTIVALGTSLPELFTSVSAAAKGKADIAVGNIVGSNIFNILFVVGMSALITPVPFSGSFYEDTLAAVGAGILLLLFSVRKHRLNRLGGALLLAGYGIYFVFVCV